MTHQIKSRNPLCTKKNINPTEETTTKLRSRQIVGRLQKNQPRGPHGIDTKFDAENVKELFLGKEKSTKQTTIN